MQHARGDNMTIRCGGIERQEEKVRLSRRKDVPDLAPPRSEQAKPFSAPPRQSRSQYDGAWNPAGRANLGRNSA